jgi:diadenosine tetraphosphate (Ap4A) HIT family hydrolase
MHLHVHLIPRFAGDVEEPAGGVRFVLPRRGNYLRPGFVPAAKK